MTQMDQPHPRIFTQNRRLLSHVDKTWKPPCFSGELPERTFNSTELAFTTLWRHVTDLTIKSKHQLHIGAIYRPISARFTEHWQENCREYYTWLPCVADGQKRERFGVYNFRSRLSEHAPSSVLCKNETFAPLEVYHTWIPHVSSSGVSLARVLLIMK